MSNLAYRENTILPADSSDGEPVYGASYQVVAYEVGAQVTSVSSGTTITVRSGHAVAASDYIIVGTDEDTYRLVASVGATSIVVTGAGVTVAVGELITNLGLDTGGTTPDYLGSQTTIYDDMAGEGSSTTNSTVTCNAQGLYKYWHNSIAIWELVLDGDGSPVAVLPDATSVESTGLAASTDNALARFDGTAGAIQNYTSGAPTAGDTGAVAIPTTLTVTGATVLNGGLAMDTDKFTVADTTGNTVVGGTLGVTGAATVSSTLAVTGTSTLSGLVTTSATTGITAYSGGGQANATQLTTLINNITTVAVTNDSVKLPTAVAGMICVVVNNGANQAAIYPQTGATIGSGSANQASGSGTNVIQVFFALSATAWVAFADDEVNGSI